jgi:hypothetical protein
MTRKAAATDRCYFTSCKGTPRYNVQKNFADHGSFVVCAEHVPAGRLEGSKLSADSQKAINHAGFYTVTEIAQ